VPYTSRIPKIALELDPAVMAALDAGAHLVAEAAKERVPVNTGRLRDAIHVEHDGDDVAVVAGDTEAFYGHIVEHGSTYVPPHPFLIPAMEANRTEVVGMVKAAIGRVV
jgi:HK97 gp10 family phage protein